VTLKTGVMILKIQLCHHRDINKNVYILNKLLYNITLFAEFYSNKCSLGELKEVFFAPKLNKKTK